MYPILFTFGPISIYAYGASILFGTIVSIIFFLLLTKRANVSSSIISKNIILLFLSTIISGRLLHVVFLYRTYLLKPLSVFNIGDGGLSLWGAIFGSAIALLYVIKREKKDTYKYLDIFSLTILLFSSVVYFGQFLQGIGLGKTTDFFMGIIVDNINSPYANVPVHPTSLYMFLISTVTLLLLLSIKLIKIKPYHGFIRDFAFIIFASSHTLIENLRWDVPYWFYGYNIEKLISILVALYFTISMFISLWQIYGKKVFK